VGAPGSSYGSTRARGGKTDARIAGGAGERLSKHSITIKNDMEGSAMQQTNNNNDPLWIDELTSVCVVAHQLGMHSLSGQLAGTVACLTLDWLAISQLELQSSTGRFDWEQLEAALPVVGRMLTYSTEPGHAVLAAMMLARDSAGIVELIKLVVRWVEERPKGKLAFEEAKRKHEHCSCKLHAMFARPARSRPVVPGGEA